MAIFSKLILGSTLLSSLALAAPFNTNWKAAWTVFETDYTTLDFTTTIWINDAKTQFGGLHQTFSHHSASTSAPLEASSPSVAFTPPAQSEPTATESAAAAPAPAEPAPAPAEPATSEPIPTMAPAASPPSSSTPVSTTPAPVVPTTPSTTPAAAPAPSPAAAGAAAAPAGGSTTPTSASDSATCEGTDAACEGDITFYDGGLGACGTNVDPNGNGIALPFAFMGAQSNGNPYCYRTLTIYNPATGESAQAEVMDKCEGCVGRSIDLTPALFNSLTNDDPDLGRVHNVQWWFND